MADETRLGRIVPSLACVLHHWVAADAGLASDRLSRQTIVSSWVGMWKKQGYEGAFRQIKERVHGPDPLVPPLRIFASALLIDDLGKAHLTEVMRRDLERSIFACSTAALMSSVSDFLGASRAAVGMTPQSSELVHASIYFADREDLDVAARLAEYTMLDNSHHTQSAALLLQILGAMEASRPCCPKCFRPGVRAEHVFTGAIAGDLKEALYR